MATDVRSEVQQLARAHQYRLHPFAMRRLVTFLSELNSDEGGRHELLRELFTLLHKECGSDRFVDEVKINAVIDTQVSRIRGVLERDGGATVSVVQLDAIPRVHVDEVTEELRVLTDAGASPPADRFRALRQRYLLARRRCLRSGAYRKDLQQQHLGGDAAPALLPTTALEGLSPDQEVAVLGMIVRRAKDLFLEDLRGRATLQLEDTVTVSPHCFVGDGFLVVVTGTWSHGALQVARIDLPPAEKREATLRDMGPSLDPFGLRPADVPAALEAQRAATQTVMVFLSQVHLDRPEAMQHLTVFFQKMQERSVEELAETAFVMTGNFSSVSFTTGDASHLPDVLAATTTLKGLLDGLGSLLATHAPAVAQHSHFILVPGPADSTGLQGVWPQPSIPTACTTGLRQRVKHLTLAPNPCRLRFLTHEMVVACRDFLRALQGSERACDLPTVKSAEGPAAAGGSTSFERVAKTILDEGHLVPELAAAVMWRVDDALRLPIVPHTLLLCDSTEQWECYYKDVHVVNPGPFSVGATFLWYTPSDGECTLTTIA